MSRDPFADAIAGLCVWRPCPIFLRVGAQDGDAVDTLDIEIRRRGLSGLIADGSPDRLAALAPLYAGHGDVVFAAVAVAQRNGEHAMRRFRREALSAGLLPPGHHGIVAADMDALLADDGPVGGRLADETQRQLARMLVEVITVRGLTFRSLMGRHAIDRVDILMIDTCGDGLDLLRGYDFTRHRPGIVQVVLSQVPPGDRPLLRALLEEQGYRCREWGDQLTAIQDPSRALAGNLPFLRTLAERCLADGWHLEASGLAAQLKALDTGDATAHLLSARANAALDRIPDALRDLLALPDLATANEDLAYRLLGRAVLAINEHLAGGRLGPAAELAALGIRLMPHHEGLLNVAMLASSGLNRPEAANHYAQQLLNLRPGHEAALHLIARHRRAAGDLMGALQLYRRLRDRGLDTGRYQEELEATLNVLVSVCAILFEAGRVEEVLILVTAGLAFKPDDLGLTDIAMNAAWNLEQFDKARPYAEAILRKQPDMESALMVMSRLAKSSGELEACRHYLTGLMRVREPRYSPFVQMSNLNELLGLLLCHPRPPDGDRRLVDEAIEAAERISALATGETDDDRGWREHFHAQIKAIALARTLDGDLPPPEPEGPVYATARGEPLGPEELRAHVGRLAPRIILLVAADENYFRRYAQLFALSVLRFIDVPCLIVLHAIGGKGRMAEMAALVGLDHERVILTGDDFDPATVTTRCIAEPTRTPIILPLAHFQSTRFRIAEHLLNLLGLPVISSDIDSLLQRGVADLLDHGAEHDIVLNRNDISLMPGGHLTANLVMFLPTQGGRRFARLLCHYLDRALAASVVSRWIDQLALLMVRNHVLHREAGIRIGYFDVALDINNLIFTVYSPSHPFRFFSLYQRFNLSSLIPFVRQWRRDLSFPPGPLPSFEEDTPKAE